MENVVYILGAGFSAPLGLPVMSNFLDTAHNLYSENKKKYEYFDRVFKSIKNKLAYVALFYNSNLDNIEEVLSILEMERRIGNLTDKSVNEFIKFIEDVIQAYTPSIEGLKKFSRENQGLYRASKPTNAWGVESDFFKDSNQRMYGTFVLKLFNARMSVSGIGEMENMIRDKEKEYTDFEINCFRNISSSTSYSVITLNYDLVLENFATHYSSISKMHAIKFSRARDDKSKSPYLAKLHGSLGEENIIPPTWNKSLQEKIELEWKLAYKLLSSANHIRFLGYSLPDNDAYVKYLLKSSLIESENLKKIDVVCLDPTGEVSKRYDLFISIKKPKYRFVSADIRNYLGFSNNSEIDLETLHEQYINDYFANRIG